MTKLIHSLSHTQLYHAEVINPVCFPIRNTLACPAKKSGCFEESQVQKTLIQMGSFSCGLLEAWEEIKAKHFLLQTGTKIFCSLHKYLRLYCEVLQWLDNEIVLVQKSQIEVGRSCGETCTLQLNMECVFSGLQVLWTYAGWYELR